MINLLPPSARQAFMIEYRARLAMVGGVFCLGVCTLGAVSLLPSYFLAQVARDVYEYEQSVTSEVLSQPSLSSAALETRAAAVLLSAVSEVLARPRPMPLLERLLSARPRGIAVSRIEYASEGGVTIKFSGVADTRDHLLSFKQNLQGLSEVAAVTLPAADLIKSYAVPFALQITLAEMSVQTTP